MNKITFGVKPPHKPDAEIATRNKRSRGRGRYGETRLSKLTNSVVVGRSKAVQTPSGKWIKIDIQHPPDCVSDIFAFENKHLAKLPASIEKIMSQAVTNCPEGLIPVGHIYNRHTRVGYFILTEQDFLDLLVNKRKEK